MFGVLGEDLCRVGDSMDGFAPFCMDEGGDVTGLLVVIYSLTSTFSYVILYINI